jgi:hypothetical protein
MTVSIRNLTTALRSRSSAITTSGGDRSDPALYSAAYTNRRQVGRAIGEEIGGFVAMTPGVQALLRYSFDRMPPVISRADGEAIRNAFPEYLGDEIPESIRVGIGSLEDDQFLLNGDFERYPDFSSIDTEAHRIQPLEEIVTGDFPLATTSVLETIFEGAYNRSEIVSGLTRDTTRSDLQGMVLQATELFNMVTPDVVEGALARVGDIQGLLQLRTLANQSNLEEFLKDFNLGSFFANTGIFGGFLDEIQKVTDQFTTVFNDIESKIDDVIPNISGALIDDVARVIDPNIRSTLQNALGVNGLDESTIANVLKPLVDNNLQAAAEFIRDFPTGLTDLGEITRVLEGISIDPRDIIEGFSDLGDINVRELVSGFGGWNGANTNVADPVTNEQIQPRGSNTTADGSGAYAFDYVDTAEEFEADVSSTTRDIVRTVLHFVDAPPGSNPNANDLHELHSAELDGIQYHYIIRRNGRVQRGRPISSAGVSGADSIDIAIVGSTTDNGTGSVNGRLDEAATIEQQRSYREMMGAFFRVIPGGDTELSADIVNDPDALDPRGSSQIPTPEYEREAAAARVAAPTFMPQEVNNCVHGRGGGSVHRPSGSAPDGAALGVQPYTGPGVSTDNTLRGNTSNVDNRLMQVFEESMAAVGLSGDVGSGYRPIVAELGGGRGRDRAGSTSGRHQGFAIDVDLYSGSAILSINVPEHLALIQEFCRVYARNCVSRGYTPGFGFPTNGTNNYMGPTRFHFDIARTLETGSRVNLSSGVSNYWLNPAQNWLPGILSEVGLGSTDRVNGPSGAVSMATLMSASGNVLAS